MPRKLTHSVRALGISLSFLIGGLLMAAFVPPTSSTGSNGLERQSAIVTATATQAAPVSKPARRHRSRSGLALPFFSFAQGLRRGNRS